MKYDIITIGGATEDITFSTSEGILIDNQKDLLRQKLLAFEYGAKIKIDSSYSSFGGGAANTAVCFSHFGFKVACIVAVGRDSRGERIIKNLKDQGVDTGLVQKINQTETGYSFLLVGPSHEHIVFSNRAANNKLRMSNDDLRNLKQTKWIYLTSLSGKWQDVVLKLFSIKNVNIAWNPGHRQILTGVKTIGNYLSKTTVLIVNKDEAIELVMSIKEYKKKESNFFRNSRNLLLALKSVGIKIVVITNGKNGADAYDGKRIYYQAVVKERKRVNTTGVGDAFGSSFIAGLELFNGDIKQAMYLGALNTSSVVSHNGAQNGLLTKRDIVKVFKSKK